MKRGFILYLNLLAALFIFAVAAVAENKTFIVVIDPGHGGRDPGAVGAQSQEKNITLAVATKLGKLINDNHKDVKVVYTRSNDKYLTLDDRPNIANKNKADLFISIHTNAARSSSPRGAETFALGLSRTKENLEVAMRENSAILLEDDYLQKYEGFDPNSSESYIIFEFMQSKHVEQSLSLASEIQKAFTTARRNNRGVKQAEFLVLRKTSMPSVLIELGFISNREEEKYMMSNQGQDQYAKSIYTAFSKYKHEYDRKRGALATTSNGNNGTANAVKETAAQQPAASNDGKVVYKIQILAADKKLPANSRQLKGYKDVDFYVENGLYKYTYGESTDFKTISELRKKVAKDFKDAFVIRFKDGKRVTN